MFKIFHSEPIPKIPVCDFCYEEDWLVRRSDNKCLNCIIAELDHRITELENEA